jgi:hypothetical protein
MKATERAGVQRSLRTLVLEAYLREALILEEAGRRLLEQASEQLRSGRNTWEPWFEAGMELQDAAKRLRGITNAR